MSEEFDPYREWLGVTAPQRPPTYYQLLGLEPFESDLQRIENSSMVLMAHVLEHDPGPHRQWAQRLFDELNEAKDTLSNPEKKAIYDALLRNSEGELLSYLLDQPEDSVAAERHTEVSPQLLYGPLRSDSDLDALAAADADVEAEEPPPQRRRKSSTVPAWAEPPPKRRWRPQLSWGSLERPWLALGAVVVLVCSLAWNLSYLPIGGAPPTPVPTLVAQLKSSDSGVRLAAARKLAKLGPLASDAAPQLVEVLRQDQDDLVRLAAADALVGAGAALESVRLDLEEILKEERNPTIRDILKDLTGQP